MNEKKLVTESTELTECMQSGFLCGLCVLCGLNLGFANET